MNWKDYEKEIYEHFKEEYPNAHVSHNVKIKGIYSKIEREIDILIEDYAAGNKITIIIDCKYFNNRIDVKDVESFLGMLQDINAHKGLLITQEGYSQAAINRAYYDPIDIELDILNFKDLKQWQAFIAIPHVGNYAVAVPAPLGWIIDGNAQGPILCYLYQRGLNFDQAKKNFEFMYINFWDKKKHYLNIDRLIENQNANILEKHPDTIIRYYNTIKRNDAETKIREADIPGYNGLEITGYVEFEEFIFFCVLLTTYELQSKNRRKLEYLLAKIIPLHIAFNNEILIKKAFRKLLKMQDKEDRAKLKMQISNWYNEMHDINNAIKVLENLISEFPLHYSASKRLLELKIRTKDTNLITTEMERYFNLDPRNLTIYNDLLEIFTKDNQTLYKFFKNKINQTEDGHILGNLYFYLAQISQSRNEQVELLEKARSHLEKVLEKDHYIFDEINKSIQEFKNDQS